MGRIGRRVVEMKKVDCDCSRVIEHPSPTSYSFSCSGSSFWKRLKVEK